MRWSTSFQAGVAALGLEPASEQTLHGLECYLGLLQRWNKKINLTAIRDAEGIAIRHFVDSMAVLLVVPSDAKTLLDAGSGAGLPGMVLALARPELSVTLCESNNKKGAFLRTVQRELQVQNVDVISARLEKVVERFDVAVSRATWDTNVWLKMGVQYVQAGGTLIGMEAARKCDLPASARRIVYPLAGSKRALIVCST